MRMYRSSMAVALWLCGCTCLLACSQKDPDAFDAGAAAGSGGGSGGGAAGSGGGAAGSAGTTDDDSGVEQDTDAAMTDAGPVEVQDYFPMIDGAEFTYRHVDGSKTYDDTTTFSTVKYKGKDAFLTTGSADSKHEVSLNTLQQVGTKIYRVHKDTTINDVSQGTVDYEPGFLRFDTSWVGKQVGFSSMLEYRRLEYNMQGMNVNDDMRSHTFTIEAVAETITVPAGKLEGCMRVRRERVLAAGTSGGDDDDKTLWFCPGVGKAKELTTTTGATEELASCMIPGRACP